MVEDLWLEAAASICKKDKSSSMNGISMVNHPGSLGPTWIWTFSPFRMNFISQGRHPAVVNTVDSTVSHLSCLREFLVVKTHSAHAQQG